MRCFSQFMHEFAQIKMDRHLWCSNVHYLQIINAFWQRGVMNQSPLRPSFFSSAEWRYHLLMMPLLFPVGNYYFIGMHYFRHLSIFLIGTGVVFGLYWLSIIVLTMAVRKVLALIPEAFIIKRIIVMLLVVGLLTSLQAVFDVWIYMFRAENNVQLV
ncbi:hypothetical protein [Runella sp.]|uniref:hypothetical protein n=1 Tax=Runella sp. TaxID=1960881 RepID=UPI003D14875B